MEDGLKDKHRRTIIEILSANGRVERAVLFGSRAMETFTPQSDVDIALFGEDLSLDDLGALSRRMDDLSMPQKVDLLIFEDIKAPKLREHIRQHGVEWFNRRASRPGANAKGTGKERAMDDNRFPTAELGPLCSKIGSGATPRGGDKVYLDKGQVALIRSQNVYNDSFSREGLVYIAEEHAEQLSNVTVESEDVLLNITGDSVARCCQVDPGILPARVNQHVAIIRPKPDELHPRFLRYFLVSPSMQSEMLAWAHAGATRKALTKGMIESFKVPRPDPRTQAGIAHVLGTLDDKIELNRRMNRTLEKMAAALFKSWFIDFDPVRAKAEGRDPGLPHDIADLFPDSFEDSELGEIPEGWTVGPLTEVATLQTKTVQPREKPDTLWEHYSIPAFDGGRVPKWERGDTIKSGKYAVPRGSVLASKLNPQFPRVWLPEISDVAVAICSTEFMPFVSIREGWRPYLYELIKSPKVQEEIRTRVSGSTGSRQRAKPKDVAVMPVLIPASEVITAFCGVVAGLHEKLLACRRNSLSLARSRNRLLPNLLNGELEMPGAEAIVK
jgi:type I restriction enzyme S subunit